MPILLALFLVFAVVTQAKALEGSQATAAVVVKADVLYWEGEELIVKEVSGHEVRLRVTPDTKVEGVVGGDSKPATRSLHRSRPMGERSLSRCRFRIVRSAPFRQVHAKRYAGS